MEEKNALFTFCRIGHTTSTIFAKAVTFQAYMKDNSLQCSLTVNIQTAVQTVTGYGAVNMKCDCTSVLSLAGRTSMHMVHVCFLPQCKRQSVPRHHT